jgi:hypothetical protein
MARELGIEVPPRCSIADEVVDLRVTCTALHQRLAANGHLRVTRRAVAGPCCRPIHQTLRRRTTSMTLFQNERHVQAIGASLTDVLEAEDVVVIVWALNFPVIG